MLNEAQKDLGNTIADANMSLLRKRKEVAALKRVVSLLRKHPDVSPGSRYDYSHEVFSPELGEYVNRLVFYTYLESVPSEGDPDIAFAEGVRVTSAAYLLNQTQKHILRRKGQPALEVEFMFYVDQSLTEEEKDLLRAVGSLQKRVSVTVTGATEEQMTLLKSLSGGVPWVSDTIACHSR